MKQKTPAYYEPAGQCGQTLSRNGTYFAGEVRPGALGDLHPSTDMGLENKKGIDTPNRG